MPKVTVIMPVYNGETYVKETIESVLNQSYADFEFVIIDDGSTDKTDAIITDFSDRRIVPLQSNHGGIVQALNLGLEVARGEYIVRIDADDICVPDRIEKLVAYMDAHEDVVVCGSWATVIDDKGTPVGNLAYPPEEDKKIRGYLRLHNPFIHPSVIIRKKAIDKVGPYRGYKHTEDYELWTRLLKVGKGHNIPEELIRYRVHPEQITKQKNLAMRFAGIKVRLLAWTRLSI